ncbi:hypothetical protein KI387_010900 [Taxus chinensis]|uniref:Uncharacterized protein n=1 Tax=Taxus chinensis TaxID=29808 RepID=A0AA38FLZ7_TAXCH|nr:hypothetical protein KI387_010900 [Taxus chinensis]
MRQWTELWFFGCFNHLMPSSDTIALQSSVWTCVVVKCLCPLSHGRNLPNFVYLRKEKLSSGWNTGLQLSGQGASRSGHSMMPRPFVVKAAATISQLDKAFPDLQEKINSNNELQSTPSHVSVDDLKEREKKKQ